MNQVAKTDLAAKKIHGTPASLQHVKNTHRTRSTNNCSPRSGRNTIAIHNTSKKKNHDHDSTSRVVVGIHAAREPQVPGRAKSTTIPRRVCKCASIQRNVTVKHNLYTTRAVSRAVGTQRQRLQLRMDGEQFWWTPTVPPATAPSPDAPQCTGESRNVREDFHTLPQSVLVTTAWDNTVPHFDLELFNQQTAMKDCLDRSPALGNSQQEYHTKCSANCSHAQTALMPNNHTDEYRADTTEKRMLTQKCRQTITNSWERATRTRDQQRCNCLHGIGVPCSRHVQSHSSPPGRQRHERNSASPDNNLAVTQQNNRSEVKCLDIPMVLAKKRRNTIATQNTNITTPLRVWSLKIKQRENSKPFPTPP